MSVNFKAEIRSSLAENGHVGLVGAERNEGGRGQRSTGVNKVRRVEAHPLCQLISI